jgi:cation/acetate symporter
MRPVFAADLQALPLTVFAIVLGVTLGITYWASKRTSTATEFWAAGRGITGLQNGFAIAGDYMSASSFLGFAGLIFLFGVDGFVGLVAALVAFLPVLLFMAERMRNAGKYTVADVLSFRLSERPARVAAAFGTLAVVFVYLIAQMVGGGVLIHALTGISFTPAVIGVGAFMLIYVIFGGMLVVLFWRRFNTAGAVTGIAFGLLSSLFFIVMSPPVWPGADTETGSPLGSFALENPALYCIPLGFLGCWLGTVLSSEEGRERTYDELNVRAQTGLGAEAGGEPVAGEERRPVGAAST